MIGPAQLGRVDEDRACRVKQQERESVAQAPLPRPPPEEPTRDDSKQRRNKCPGEINRARAERFQRRCQSGDQVIQRRCRVRRCAGRKILERVMTNNQPRLFEAHPDPRHPRITIRVREEDLAINEDLSVIRAPRRDDQDRKNDQLDDRDNNPTHSAVLIEIRKSKSLLRQTGYGGRVENASGLVTSL